MMDNSAFESLKSPCFDNFYDTHNMLTLWQSALHDPAIVHCHIRGPKWSGKTHILSSTLHIAHQEGQVAVWLTSDDFTSDKLLEKDYAQWFYLDDIDVLTPAQQSIFVAWMNQTIASGGKIFTTSGLQTDMLCNDVRSRLQSSFIITLGYPDDDVAWAHVMRLFFLRHYIVIPDKIVRCILDVTQGVAERIFPLMCELAHQPRQLTFQRVHAIYRALQRDIECS